MALALQLGNVYLKALHLTTETLYSTLLLQELSFGDVCHGHSRCVHRAETPIRTELLQLHMLQFSLT